MTGTDLYKRTHKSVPVIFEPPCSYQGARQSISEHFNHQLQYENQKSGVL